MGKGNIKLTKDRNTWVIFMKDGKTVRSKVKDEVLESITRITSEEESRKESLKLLKRPMSILFEVEK
jgi:hypothetical protein